MIRRLALCLILVSALLMTACNTAAPEPTETELGKTQPSETKATEASTEKPTEKLTEKPTEAPESQEPESKVEYYDVEYKIGSIKGATGVDFENNARFVCKGYIAVADIQAVTLSGGYCLSWFAYDADHNYLGNGSNTYPTMPTAGVWLGEGRGVTAEEIIRWNADTIYIRFAVKKSSGSAIDIEEDVEMSDVKVYVSGYESPDREADYVQVGSIQGGLQDGAVYGDYMFSFDATGRCKVYSSDDHRLISEFVLHKNDLLSPHSNAVCFGTYKYAETDEFPLLYCNIYNTYSKDRALDGTCNVYRITRDGTAFSNELVQIIKVGFTSDTERWSSAGGDVRPYGNFAVDTDNNKLYAFTMRDESRTTRFFEFDLPTLGEGTIDPATGVKKVTLEVSDVIRSFDVEYSRYIQGATYADGKIYSLEGFTNDLTNKAALKIVDLEAGTLSAHIDLYGMGLTTEPEMAYVIDDVLYYVDASGRIYKLILD